MAQNSEPGKDFIRIHACEFPLFYPDSFTSSPFHPTLVHHKSPNILPSFRRPPTMLPTLHILVLHTLFTTPSTHASHVPNAPSPDPSTGFCPEHYRPMCCPSITSGPILCGDPAPVDDLAECQIYHYEGWACCVGMGEVGGFKAEGEM